MLRLFLEISPSFLSSCNVSPSLLLGLCLCLYNPLCLPPVDCSVLHFAPWFHLHMLLTVSSLSFSCCGTQLLIIIVQLWDLCLLSEMDLRSVVLVVVALSFQHFSALVLPISSISSHVCQLWLFVMSIFLHFCDPSVLTLLLIVVSFFSCLK